MKNKSSLPLRASTLLYIVVDYSDLDQISFLTEGVMAGDNLIDTKSEGHLSN